jgi:hypothetical protein
MIVRCAFVSDVGFPCWILFDPRENRQPTNDLEQKKMNEQEKKRLRKKLYVNPEVQRTLILRSILHWFFYMCAILLVVVIFTSLRDPSQVAIALLFKSFVYFAPAIIASVILLPLFVYDILKSSNRVAGPIFRLRNEIRTLASGEDIKELRFRDGDHWFELAEDFNVLAKQLIEARRDGSESEPSVDEQQAEPVAS